MRPSETGGPATHPERGSEAASAIHAHAVLQYSLWELHKQPSEIYMREYI